MARLLHLTLVVVALSVVLLVGGRPVLAAVNGQASANAEGFVEGSLALAASRDSAILSAAGLRPGQRIEGSIRISNTGSLRGRLSLTAQTTGGRLLAERLQLVVTQVGRGQDRVLYSGPLAGLRAIPAGVLPAGGGQTFRLAVRLPIDAGNELQGLTTTATFGWTAVAS